MKLQPLTVETVGITPKVPAAKRISCADRLHLRINDDDVVQLCNLVVASVSRIRISNIISGASTLVHVNFLC